MTLKPTQATPTRRTEATDLLGECPTWRAGENALYWIDVRGRALRRLSLADGGRRDWDLQEMIGSWAFAGPDHALVALETRIARLSLADGTLEDLHAPHAGVANMRFNDGRCDPAGRFWVGSMNDRTRAPVGRLYRIDGDGCAPVLDEVAVPNALCWSPDGTRMFFSDGREQTIHAYDYDLTTGTPSNPRAFARVAKGVPDGATTDAEGCLWCAIYGDAAIHRYAPDGALAERIELPVSQPTHCAFGGPDRRTLFITTARQKLAPDILASQPLAGAVLALETDAQGMAEPEFAH